MTTKKPDREFLELALKRLMGNLEGIEEGRLYANLAEARDGVRSRLDGVKSELIEIEAQIQDQEVKLQKFEAIATLDQVTQNWIREAQKLLTAYEHFSAKAQPQLIQDVQSVHLIAGYHEAMLNYLKQITWR